MPAPHNQFRTVTAQTSELPKIPDQTAISRTAAVLLLSHMSPAILLWQSHRKVGSNPTMREKTDILQGTLALMILKTLDSLGPLHGYGIARRIEQTSGDLISLNYGTLYPALIKLEQEGCISSAWGLSDNHRKAKFYKLTRAGRKQLDKETRDWQQSAAILARFLVQQEPSS